MSFYSEVEEFFENESTDCDYCLREYDADDMGRRYAEYLRLFKLQPGDKSHLEFLCSEIESHISRGKNRYGEIEQEWGLLKHYYDIEAKRAASEKVYDPFRLQVLMDFVLQLEK